MNLLRRSKLLPVHIILQILGPDSVSLGPPDACHEPPSPPPAMFIQNVSFTYFLSVTTRGSLSMLFLLPEVLSAHEPGVCSRIIFPGRTSYPSIVMSLSLSCSTSYLALLPALSTVIGVSRAQQYSLFINDCVFSARDSRHSRSVCCLIEHLSITDC